MNKMNLRKKVKLRGRRGAIAFITAVSVCHTPLSGHQSPLTPATKDVVNAIRSGGLPAAASLVGQYVGFEDGDVESSASDLDEVAQSSAIVVRVSIVSKSPSQLSDDNTTMTTDYLLTIEERFQGSMSSGSQVTLRMPGGRIQFANGTTAEIRGGRVPTMQIGEEYVLFLRQLAPQGPFVPALGPQSLFTFSTDGKTMSRARGVDEVFRKYQGMPRENFLQVVRTSVTP